MKALMQKGRPIWKTGAGLLLLALTAAPLFYLAIGLFVKLAQDPASVLQKVDGGMLLQSMLLNLAAAGLSVLLGLLVALGGWMFFPKRAVKIALGLLLFILIPPFIHVQSWIYFMDRLYALWNGWTGAAANFSGSFAVILTVAFAYLPITAGLTLLTLTAVPAELADVCRMESRGLKGFLRLYMPMIYPAMLLSGLLVFLLNINDYGIPSLFGVNVFALELFARYSAGGTIHSVFFASLPLMLLCMAILGGMGWYLSRSSFSFSGFESKNPYEKESALKLPAAAGMVILALFLFVPLVNLLVEAVQAQDILRIFTDSGAELLYSIGISGLTAVLSLIPGLLFAYWFYRAKARSWLLAISALPFLIPSPIGGLSLIGMWNTPLLQNIYTSPIMPAIAMTARFAFLAAAILSMAVSRLDPALFDNLRLHHPGPWRFFCCLLAMVWKEVLAAGLMVFALAMGEFGMTLLVTPPGYQTLTIKIYNYLHYGASETVAVLCLFMLLLVLLIWVCVYALWGKRTNE